jgi:glycosyltransferase involved in cell wall biosynthesis
VRDEIPEIRLTILGRGDQMDSLVALRDELDLRGHVELRDEYLPAEQLPEVIATATLGVVPYRDDLFTDGLLPTKLMEYAVMGLPSIASRTTAIDALFRDTMVEFFTAGDADDLARCIRTLHADPTRRAALARGATNFTRRYNWQRIGAEYVALVTALPRRASSDTGRVGGPAPASVP